MLIIVKYVRKKSKNQRKLRQIISTLLRTKATNKTKDVLSLFIDVNHFL